MAKKKNEGKYLSIFVMNGEEDFNTLSQLGHNLSTVSTYVYSLQISRKSVVLRKE